MAALSYLSKIFHANLHFPHTDAGSGRAVSHLQENPAGVWGHLISFS
jgi:hypothetical protein